MRTLQKDLRRVTVLTTMNPVPNATSGNGIWSDGTSWHMQKTAVGEFTMFFDSRIFVISGSVGPLATGRQFYKFEAQAVGAGSVRIQVLDSTGAAVDVANFDVTINVLDTRT
jgi:hypothetical protein